MYCSSLGLEDKGGVQSDMPLNGCLGGNGFIFEKKKVDSERPAWRISQNQTIGFSCCGILGVGMKPRPLERTHPEVGSRV